MKKPQLLFWRKKKNAPMEDAPQNEYYESVSANLGIFQVILYFSLFAFVVLSFFSNTRLITYQNFYYFFKDLNASVESSETYGSDSVTYPSNPQQSFSLYRKGLAVAGNKSVSVFTATGKQALSKIVNYQNPTAVGTGKYLMVYEMGGTHYSLYNSYTQVHTGKTEKPILGATVSDSGMYALITLSDEYSTVVWLYDSHFSLLSRYNKTGYVMDVELDGEGERIALLTSAMKNGLYQTRLELYKTGKKEPEAEIHVGDTVGLSCAFTSSGAVSVLSGDAIRFYSSGGALLSSFSFDGLQMADAELDADGATVCLKPPSASSSPLLVVFDKNGKTLYQEYTQTDVEALSREGNSVYLLSYGVLERLNLRTKQISKKTCNTDQRTLLAVNEDEALLCSSQKAEYIRFR